MHQNFGNVIATRNRTFCFTRVFGLYRSYAVYNVRQQPTMYPRIYGKHKTTIKERVGLFFPSHILFSAPLKLLRH